MMSEGGINIFDRFEECHYSKDTLLDAGKLRTIFGDESYLGFEVEENAKIRLITPLDVAWFAAIVSFTGYLFSCAILWVHRKNRALNGTGRAVYPAMAALFVPVFYASVAVAGYEHMRLLFLLSLALAYGGATCMWMIYSTEREVLILKKVRKVKKR